MERDDTELLNAYQRDSNEDAFVTLVDRHSGWIFAAARRRLGSDHLADDATQSVFVVLISKAPELLASRRGSLSPWLFHVMHFTCARLRRDQIRQVEHEHTAGKLRLCDDPRSALAAPELVVSMEQSISELASDDREMIVRRFYQRQSFGEVGMAMGISAEAARKRVTRALARVKETMFRNAIDSIPDFILEEFESPNSTSANAGAPRIDTTRIKQIVQESKVMAAQTAPSDGGHQMISAEFLVRDVEENLAFFEKLGFPRRWLDKPDATGRLPRASLTAGQMGKIWIRRAPEPEIHPSPSINVFFWINGGPDALIAHRKTLIDLGIRTTEIIDEHGLPNFNVITPDGYSIAFFTQYVPPNQPPVVLVE